MINKLKVLGLGLIFAYLGFTQDSNPQLKLVKKGDIFHAAEHMDKLITAIPFDANDDYKIDGVIAAYDLNQIS